MNEKPLVSVLMTAYNREKYIAEAIDSVLASSYTNFELIIVDDQSKDTTVEIAKSYEAKDKRITVYINNENLGDYPNRNQAAKYAKGKYIKYVDADDCVYYYGLEVMVKYMEAFPDAGFGLCTTFRSCKLPVMITPYEIYKNYFFNGYDHLDRPPLSAIFKNETFKILGGFSGERMVGDSEFLCRLSQKNNMVILPAGLYYYRLHDEQESQTDYGKKSFELVYKIFQKALSHKDCPLSPDEVKAAKKKLLSYTFKLRIIQWKRQIFN